MSHASAIQYGDDCFRLAMATSAIGVAIADCDGRWREVNPVLAGWLGYPPTALVGRDIFASADGNVHVDADARAVWQAMAGGAHDRIDQAWRLPARDGHELALQANAALMRDADGEPLYWVVQLQPLATPAPDRDAEDSAGRQLQLFADAVAHDLRAPLRSIENFARRLEERAADALDATGRDHLSRIRTAAARMDSLLVALGELSTATRAELRPGTVDLSLLADWVAMELRDAHPQQRAEVVVQPGLVTRGDERLLKLALAQVIGNAWKFSRAREQVRIEVAGETDAGGLHLHVRDAGSGFDMRYADKLFEPFQRLHGPEDGGGHGLGLAIARRIVDRHHGRITAESETGVGSTFHIELPGYPGRDCEPCR